MANGKVGAQPSNRQLKVGQEIKQALAQIFMRGDFIYGEEHKSLRNASITVSEVRVSPDLQDAKAYVMPLGGVNASEVVKDLNDIAQQIRATVTKMIHVKFSPKIRFYVDDTFEYANKINELLQRPEVRKDILGIDEE